MRKSIMDISRVAGACCGLGLAADVAMAGPGPTITVLSRDANFIDPVGSVTNFGKHAVNNSGTWAVVVDTDGPADFDFGTVKNGAKFLQENDPIDPPNLAVHGFGGIRLNADGDLVWNLNLRNPPGVLNVSSGVYINTSLLIQEDSISTAPQFTAGTPYIGFFDPKFNDNNDIVLMASVDDVNIATTVDRAIVRVTLDGMGNVASETVIAKEGDILPGQTEAVAEFGTSAQEWALNNAGQVMFVADLAGSTATDGVIYLDGTILAQEGSPSPAAGRNWLTLSTSVKMDLNNNGDYVHTGVLAGDTISDNVIIKNGAIFRQEGEELTTIAPHALTAFGSGPVLISDGGDVLWYGDWNDADTTIDTGLFINEELLLQENTTVVDGETVTTIRGIESGYNMSPDGRYITVRVVLSFSGDALLLIDRGEQGGDCPADWNEDGAVNSGDISAFLTSWLASVNGGTLEADFNNDLVVNSGDISAFLTAWLDAVQNGC